MSTNTPVHVHVQTGTTEVLRIVATILFFGGVGAVAWSFAQGQYADVAATGMTMTIVMMVKLLYSRGMIAVPSNNGQDQFAVTKGNVQAMLDEYKGWLASTSMPAMALISVLYAVAFLVLRAGIATAFGLFQNIVVAGGFAAVIGALVVFPSLLPGILAGLKRKGVVTDAPASPAPAPAPVVQAPAPVPAQSAPVKKVVKAQGVDNV